MPDCKSLKAQALPGACSHAGVPCAPRDCQIGLAASGLLVNRASDHTVLWDTPGRSVETRTTWLLNHLVRPDEDGLEPERLSGLDNQLDFVGSSTGRSAGLAALRILST